MLKKLAFAAAGIALLASPLLASADTASELQARISALLAQIAQLQQQLNSLQTTTPVETPQPVFDPVPTIRVCPQILRTLEQGISGNDVKEVQAYLGVTQTGYFGPATAQAVSAFQGKEGLTQVGIVGPMTRAAFARRCGWGGNNQTFNASPTSGAAPLTVTFTVRNAASTSYINYGDGSATETMISGCYFGDRLDCTLGTLKSSHTYTAAGTYTATLSQHIGGPMGPEQILGTVTITVGGPISSQSFTASPTSGAAPLSVKFTKTGTEGDFSVNFGDGTSGTMQSDCAYGPASCSMTSSVKHTYSAPGTYVARLYNNLMGCAGNNVDCSQGSVTIIVTNTPQTGGITVTSPNGGERLDIGSQKTITWGDGRTSVLTNPYDIFLDRVGPTCTNPLMGCPAIAYMPLTIAKGVTARSYSWTVGNVLESVVGNKTGPGDYTVRICDSNNTTCDSSDSQFTVVDPVYESNKAPEIKSFTGPASLTVGQKGTWIVTAFDPEGKKLTYTYSWCDVTNGGNGVCTAQAYPVGGETTNAYTTHFPSAGTYKASVSVGDDIGKSAQASVIVTVTGSANPTLTASPTSGTAPLFVIFKTNIADATVDFGDGTSGTVSPNCMTGLDGQSNCNTGSYLATHTYTSAGTYTATLTTIGSCSWGTCAQTASATVTVTGGSTACEVTDIYAEGVPGYVYYNLFMKVRNLPGATTKMPVVAIMGAESWDNLTFSQVGYSSGITTLQASQTVNGTGINYIMERKYTIRPISNGGSPITCTPMGGVGVGYPVPPPLYPTSGVVGTSGSSGTNINLANALSALESALKAIIAKLGQ